MENMKRTPCAVQVVGGLPRMYWDVKLYLWYSTQENNREIGVQHTMGNTSGLMHWGNVPLVVVSECPGHPEVPIHAAINHLSPSSLHLPLLLAV